MAVPIDPAVLAEAMIQNRDGIVGTWTPPGSTPTAMNLDDPDYLVLWEPAVRASIIDFDLVSKLGFINTSSATKDQMTLTNVELASGGPNYAYNPLVVITRPPKQVFATQLTFVNAYSDLREDRAYEILSQLTGPVAFLGSIPFLNPDRTRYTLELLAAAVRLANYTEMRFKHALACRRPNEYSPQVQPMIMTPSHGTYPMGHATEAFIAAYVLLMLLQSKTGSVYAADTSWGTQLMRLAARVAANRIVAGLHFPVDAAVGTVLGLTLGQYFVNRCTGGTNYIAWAFDGSQFPSGSPPPDDGDYYWTSFFDETQSPPTQIPANPYATPVVDGSGNPVKQPLTASNILAKIWNLAAGEWP